MKQQKPPTAAGAALPFTRQAVHPDGRDSTAPSRVELIRQAIAEGRFDVSSHAIADRLVARVRSHSSRAA